MSFERASINFLEMIIEQVVFQSIPPRRTQLAPAFADAFADALADEGWDAAQYYSAEEKAWQQFFWTRLRSCEEYNGVEVNLNSATGRFHLRHSWRLLQR